MNVMTLPMMLKASASSYLNEEDWTTSSNPTVEALAFAGALVALIVLIISLLGH